MSLLFRVALLGFSAPERSALAGCFRLVTHRVPRYEQVQLADHADLMVADADDDLSARQVLDSGRLPDTVLVGRRPLPGAAASLPRPVDPSQVLRSLDMLAAARALGRHGLAGAAGAARPVPWAATARGADPTEPRRSTIEAALDRTEARPMADAGGARTGSHGPDASPAPGAPQALLVDPSEIALRFLQTRLARLGVASRTARDSTEALSLLQRFDPDLVFIDAELAPASPLDGLALARRVRAEYETRVPPLPVFALASRIGEVDRVRATLAGCYALRATPPAYPLLAARLARHGSGRADFDPAS